MDDHLQSIVFPNKAPALVSIEEKKKGFGAKIANFFKSKKQIEKEEKKRTEITLEIPIIMSSAVIKNENKFEEFMEADEETKDLRAFLKPDKKREY